MHIAIDATPLESGHRHRGTGSYTKNLIEALQQYEKERSYTFFVRGENIPKDADLVHYPYFDPFFLTLPLTRPKTTVVTVHDLIPLVFPDKFPSGIRGQLKWFIQKLSLTGCSAIVTDSETSKKDIIRIAGISESSVFVIPLAPAPHFKQITDKRQLSKVKNRYNLPEKFLLYVGDVNWNKNVIGMLKAFHNIKYQISNIKYTYQKLNRQKQLELVLVGKAFFEKHLPEVRELSNLIDSGVLRLGFVPDEDLPAIYSLASVYVQPSFYEGFGLPVLEAMACGCPTVVSNTPALLEIAGPSIVVDPNDATDISRGIKQAFGLSKDDWAKKALGWVSGFSWQKVARQTVSVYKRVLSNK